MKCFACTGARVVLTHYSSWWRWLIEWNGPPWNHALLTLRIKGYIVRQHTIVRWTRQDRITSTAAIDWPIVTLGSDDEFSCSVSYLKPVPITRLIGAVVNLDGYLITSPSRETHVSTN